MKLKKILKNISYKTIKGKKDVEITGICSDSRYVAPGNLFIARKGEKFDATNFIQEAILAGAVAIITDIFDPFLNSITQVIIDDVGSIEADIAANYYNYPDKELFTIGITGTNGKTTTSYLIKHILDQNEKKCSLIGSVEYIIGDNHINSTLTTPDAISNQKFLREIVLEKSNSVVIETSSHGLDQNRLKNINFNAAIFTNLTLDHLDYHKTFKKYLEAKKKLFTSLKKDGIAIINIDDEASLDILNDITTNSITYGIKNKADVMATSIKYSLLGTNFVVIFEDQKQEFFIPLIGLFNVYNALAVICLSLNMKIPLEKVNEDFASFKKVPGRLEKIDNKLGVHIFVDSAHTDDALKNVLSTLNNIKKTKIITVFGAGGDRDKTKRSKMAKVVEEFSNLAIVTNDNPRSEDPKKIIDEIILGFSKNSSYIIEEDRHIAIKKAIHLAKEEDVVLIAGKGHEKTQIFNNKTYQFDDCQIVKELCENL